MSFSGFILLWTDLAYFFGTTNAKYTKKILPKTSQFYGGLAFIEYKCTQKVFLVEGLINYYFFYNHSNF